MHETFHLIENQWKRGTGSCEESKLNHCMAGVLELCCVALLQLDEVLKERREELKANHRKQLERLRQEQDTELRRMQLEMQEKVSVVVGRFYVVPFSALQQTHCTLAAWDSK